LAATCERLDVEKDAIIATQGEPANSMHFILEGRIRVRSLGPHTTIGQMGLITSQLRSATIQAEVPSVLYALSAEAYERKKRDNEPLAQALLTYVVSIMAERLSFASKVIGVLRRCRGEFLHPIAARRRLVPPARARNLRSLSFLRPSFSLE
jgi:SulP family sulfate permease